MGFDIGRVIVESPKIIAFIILCIILIIGIIILLSGIIRHQKSRKFIRTEGVIMVKKGVRLDHGKPNVRYQVGDYTYTYTSPIGQNVAMKHGKKVDVLYHPNDPTQVMIDTFIQRGGRRIIGGSIMITSCILAIPFIFILLKINSFIPN